MNTLPQALGDLHHFQWMLGYPLNLCVCVCMLSHFSCVWLFATPWAVARQVPLSMGFSRQAYWSGLPCPPPGDLPTQGSNLRLICFLYWQAGSLSLVLPGKPRPLNISEQWKRTSYHWTFCLFTTLDLFSNNVCHVKNKVKQIIL